MPDENAGRMCPKCGQEMEFVEAPEVVTSCAAPMWDMYFCHGCTYFCPADTG